MVMDRMVQATGSLDDLLDGIRAAADPSRLRLLAICSQGEWTVSELVPDPGPEPAAHLPPSQDPGRGRACSTASARAAGCSTGVPRPATAPGWRVRCAACCPTTTPACSSDQRRLEAVREARRRQAEQIFRRARRRLGQRARPRDRRRRWSRRRCASCSPPSGRPTCSTSAPAPAASCRCWRGRSASGSASTSATTCWRWPAPISTSARRATARSATATCTSCRCRTRSFAAATLHQVLHFADDPFAALAEAARVLAPGGRLVVVDLARARAGAAARARSGIAASASATRRSAAGSPSSAWSQEPPRRLAGPELTVVIWTARRPPAGADDDNALPRRNAA